MGLDLNIGILNQPLSHWWLCLNRLRFGRDYILFEEIGGVGRCPGVKQLLDPKPIPSNVRVDWYKDEGIEEITEDAYGGPLTYVTAGEFEKISIDGDISPYNLAVLKFLTELPKETPIVLYWC